MLDREIYPEKEWDYLSPKDAGLDEKKLDRARAYMDQNCGDKGYRVVVLRGGKVTVEWNKTIGRNEKLGLASAAKSIFSCILAIAVREGKIASPDARLVDYYPEAVDVPPGEGPKEGRYAFPEDREITFRQLISNTSGYMKPGEEPGKVFHYQTFGMNVLTHAIAIAYGLYTVDDPEGSPGMHRLIDEKIGIPIGANFEYYKNNFDLHDAARINIFGYYAGVKSNALDMARLGLLWLREGLWEDKEIVPRGWIKEATKVAPFIIENCPREQWGYGYGFWTNEKGVVWPSLPRDSYAAHGAGRKLIWVCPSRDLVVVESPGVYKKKEDEDRGLVRMIVDACS